MKIFRNFMITIFILAIIAIGAGFASGASVENAIDVFSSDDDYLSQGPLVYSNPIKEIDINVDSRDVIIQGSNLTTQATLTHYRLADETWSISMTDGILSVTQKDPAGISGWFNWYFGGEKDDIVITLPQNIVEEITVSVGGGSIHITDLTSLTNVGLDVGGGSISIENVTTDNLDTTVEGGSINLTDTIVNEEANVEVGDGSINITSFEAQKLSASVDGGSINVTNLTSNEVDLTVLGGSIAITGIDLSDKSVTLNVDGGTVVVNGSYKGFNYTVVNNNSTNYINCQVDGGSITLNE